MSRVTNITETLEAIKDSSENSKISFGDIVKALNHRGFGPLIVGPALITALPTGAIPGIPAICGLFIALVCAQMVIGRPYPWLPKKLKGMSFDREQYIKNFDKVKSYTKKIDSFFHPRFKFLVSDFAQRVIAVICLFLALITIGAGFIPFLPLLPAFTILLFGVGVSVHDGLLTALGMIFLSITLIVVPWMIFNFIG